MLLSACAYWYGGGIELVYIIAMLLSNYSLYHVVALLIEKSSRRRDNVGPVIFLVKMAHFFRKFHRVSSMTWKYVTQAPDFLPLLLQLLTYDAVME